MVYLWIEAKQVWPPGWIESATRKGTEKPCHKLEQSRGWGGKLRSIPPQRNGLSPNVPLFSHINLWVSSKSFQTVKCNLRTIWCLCISLSTATDFKFKASHFKFKVFLQNFLKFTGNRVENETKSSACFTTQDSVALEPWSQYDTIFFCLHHFHVVFSLVRSWFRVPMLFCGKLDNLESHLSIAECVVSFHSRVCTSTVPLRYYISRKLSSKKSKTITVHGSQQPSLCAASVPAAGKDKNCRKSVVRRN